MHACGHHASLLADKSNYFQPTSHVCAICAAKDKYDRVLRADDEAARKGRKPSDPDPADGRTTYMRLVPPDEVASRASAAPTAPQQP